jgi:hypothetical protein
MKRSRQVVLVLSGGLSLGALTGCDSGPDNRPPPVNAQNTYTNNHYVSRAGYYHAPYHAWFPYPYNYHEPVRGYYHGGSWTQQPETPKITYSQPTPEAAKLANDKSGASKPANSTTRRSGFGSSSRSIFS